MAGAFTHMALVGEATKSFKEGSNSRNLLDKYESFVVMGAVSPDIPYLSPKAILGGTTWADIFHYHRTNGIVQNAVHTLKASKLSKSVIECQLAWLLGFTSHLVADATIHPIVEATVGPCANPETKSEHTKCEMIQDVFVFHENNLELTAAEWTRHLEDCKRHKNFKSVVAFWEHHAMMNCPSGGKPDIPELMGSYKKLLDTAEGGNDFAKIFRHVFKGYAYQRYDELEDDDLKKYVSEVKLPDGRRGDFMVEGFAHAAKNISSVWSRIFRYIYETDNISEIIPNWNLDTGICQNTHVCTYWS